MALGWGSEQKVLIGLMQAFFHLWVCGTEKEGRILAPGGIQRVCCWGMTVKLFAQDGVVELNPFIR